MFRIFRRWPILRRAGVVLFALPLMFAGGSLVGNLAEQTVGGVGSLEISRHEFASVYQNIAEQYRRQYGLEEIPPDLAQAIGNQTRSRLISEYLVRAAAEDKSIYASDAAVAAEIRRMPDFQDETGQFSISLFHEYAPDARQLEIQVRRSLQRQALLAAMRAQEIPAVRDKLAAYRRQQRVVEETTIPVTATFNIGENDISRYYSENRREYEIREEADWEYIVLSADSLINPDITPDEDTLSLAISELQDEHVASEQRTVRHIFIAGEDAEARAKAEEIAEQAEADPDSFADLAREFSEDAGTAGLGGDLGLVVRGDLPGAMDAEVFALETDEIGGPVLVDGGFSILQVESSSSAPINEEDLREQAQERARRILARDELLETSERLQELAHINIGSLLTVAAQAEVSIQTVLSVTRTANANDEDLPRFFRNDEVLTQLFANEIIQDGETSPAIVVDDDTYLMARTTRYQSAQLRPLPEVSDSIVQRLSAREQIVLMQESANSGIPENAEWSALLTLSLLGEEDEIPVTDTGSESDTADAESESESDSEIDLPVRGEIFATDLSRGTPAYALVAGEGEVRAFRISEAINPPSEAEDVEAITQLLSDAAEAAAFNAYLTTLTSDYDIYFDDEPLQSAQPLQ